MGQGTLSRVVRSRRFPVFVSLTLAAGTVIALLACSGGKKAEPTPVPTQPAPAPTATQVPPTAAPAPTAAPTPAATATPRPAPATPVPVATTVPTATPTPRPPTPVPTSTPLPRPVVKAENPNLILEVLEGKAQYRTAANGEWQTAFDGQPVQQGWFVRTLAVSSAVLHFSDGSKVRLSPTTEVTAELYELIDGGPPTGERHARVRVVDGEIDFDVAQAVSPPNTWVFVTTDGAVTIQGTKGSLKRRVALVDATPAGGAGAAAPGLGGAQGPQVLKVDFKVNLLDGTASFARVTPGEKGDKSEVQAAVIQPGVDFAHKAEIPIPAGVINPQGATGGAPQEALAAAKLLDRDNNGQFDANEFVLAKDLNVLADRGFIKKVDFVKGVAEAVAGGPQPGFQPGGLLAELQAIALGGPTAIDELKKAGNLESARTKAIEELATKSKGASRALETFGLTEKASEQAKANLGILALNKDDTDPKKLLGGAKPVEFFNPIGNVVKADDITGKKPDLGGLLNRFDNKFGKPEAVPIFDESGKIIGAKKPDAVVFDPKNGLPIGKKPGDLVAIDETGKEVGALNKDVFFLQNPDGKQELVPTTFYNAFMQKAAASKTDSGLPGEIPLSLVTFDDKGNVVPSIVQYDDSGNPVGIRPFTPDLKDATGQDVALPVNPYVLYDNQGKVKEAKEVPGLAKDESGKQIEFKLPSPIAYDKDGKPAGLVAPGKVIKSDNGIAGLEAGNIIGRDFFVTLAQKVLGDQGGPQGPAGSPTFAPLEQLLEGAGQFALKPGEQPVFDAAGIAKTAHEFRPQIVVRDQATGQETGGRPITGLNCFQKDCFAQAAGNEALLNKLEEKLQVFAKGADGKPVLAELQGHALFTAEGGFGGYVPPAIALQGAAGGTFAADNIQVFAGAGLQAGGPQGPALGDAAAKFGIQIPSDGALKLAPRGDPTKEFAFQIDPSKFALPAAPGVGGAAGQAGQAGLGVLALAPNAPQLGGIAELAKPRAAEGGAGAGAQGPLFDLKLAQQFAPAFGGVAETVNPGVGLFDQIKAIREKKIEGEQGRLKGIAGALGEAVKAGDLDPSKGFLPKELAAQGAQGGQGGQAGGPAVAIGDQGAGAVSGVGPSPFAGQFPAGLAGILGGRDPSQLPESLKGLAGVLQAQLPGGETADKSGQGVGGPVQPGLGGLIGSLIGGGTVKSGEGQFPGGGAVEGRFPGGGAAGGQFPGGAGQGTIVGGGGQGTIAGGGGIGTIAGGAGQGTIVGGAGQGTIVGGAGQGTIVGGTGQGTIVKGGEGAPEGGTIVGTIKGPVTGGTIIGPSTGGTIIGPGTGGTNVGPGIGGTIIGGGIGGTIIGGATGGTIVGGVTTTPPPADSAPPASTAPSSPPPPQPADSAPPASTAPSSPPPAPPADSAPPAPPTGAPPAGTPPP